jgi:hypothetical protein
MYRRAILPLLLALTIIAIAACGGATGPEQSDASEPQPMAQAPTESPLPTAAPAAESPLPSAAVTTGESVTEVQPPDWETDEEKCLLPGAVITGTDADLPPCEPAEEEPTPEAEEETDAMPTEPAREEPAPTEPAAEEAAQPQAEADEASRVAALAADDLAQQLGIPASDVEVREVRAVTWPDASLGCPEPDMMYAQMLQEGYLIRLSADGEIYHYHSGGGQPPFLCENSLELLPPDVRDALEFVPPPDSEIDATD